MARLSRKLRVCKWLGTVGCVLIATAFVVSGWYSLVYSWMPQQAVSGGGLFNSNAVLLYVGYVGIRQAAVDRPYSGWLLRRTSSWHVFHAGLFPSIIEFSEVRVVLLPLWFPFLVLLIPTLLLWRRDRRRLPGHCRRCDYDLTGNASGVSPECGLEITVAARK